MKIIVNTILLLLMQVLSSVSYSQTLIRERLIDEGVIYKKIINTDDTLSVDILKIDLSECKCSIKSFKAKNLLNERETTGGMVSRLRDSGYFVLGAVNADFFEKDGEVINNMISGGEIVKAVKFTDSPFNRFVNSQFALTEDNKPLIEKFVFSGYIIFPDGTVESLSRVNSEADSNSIVLYNRFQGEFTPARPENSELTEIQLNLLKSTSDTLLVTAVEKFHKGNTSIADDQLVLSANSRYSDYLSRNICPGDTFRIVIDFNPDYGRVQESVGGWPRLVSDGENLIIQDNSVEGVTPNFSDKRHPRTGIGFSKDSTLVYFITVDGRQKKSRGMSLREFADLMIEEGIYQGLNLDGGGSTTMIVNNEIVNSPSDLTGERPVGNCLVILKRD